MNIESLKEVQRSSKGSVWVDAGPWYAYNRTGADTVVGSIYMFDDHMTQAEVTDWGKGSSGVFGNIISQAVTVGTDTAHTQDACGFVALEVKADNELVKGVVIGETTILATTVAGFGLVPGSIQAGSRVTFSGGTANYGLVVNAAGTGKLIAKTLEATVWAASETPTAVRVFFNGIEGVHGR